jgi:uncharacterized caspase-like protein
MILAFTSLCKKMSNPLRELKTYGHDLSTVPVSKLPKTLERAAFLCVNSYTSYRLSLGTGPINDAVSFAKAMKRYNYDVYFLHNPRQRSFLQYLDAFFKAATQQLVFYYVGHGTSVRDVSGDEADGYDEAFVFEDGNIVDDDLIEHLIDNKNKDCRLILVTDACHSGTIWDIQGGNVKGRELPANIISISAAADAQTAKQTTIDRLDQGVFTYNLAKTLKAQPALSPQELQEKMRTILKKYAQTFTVGTTTNTLLREPLFS